MIIPNRTSMNRRIIAPTIVTTLPMVSSNRSDSVLDTSLNSYNISHAFLKVIPRSAFYHHNMQFHTDIADDIV